MVALTIRNYAVKELVSKELEAGIRMLDIRRTGSIRIEPEKERSF